MSDDLHSAIMNLQIPMDPKIPSDAGVMLAYKLGHRDARHAAAELTLSTPPAAIPAEPSAGICAHAAPSLTKSGERCAPILAQHNGVRTHDRRSEEGNFDTGSESAEGDGATRSNAVCSGGIECRTCLRNAAERRDTVEPDGVTPLKVEASPLSAALLEAVDDVLERAPCDCSHRKRYEDGEHTSGCYLFDLNIARAALSQTMQPQAEPAAPSDAVRPCEYCDDTGDVHGLDGEWRGVCICPAGAALAQPVQEVATTPAIPKGDLSKVWQAADDVCEWLNYEVSEKSPGLLKSIETLNEAMGRAEIRAGRAEPAAGEQGRPTKITPETPVECTTCGGMVVGVAGEQAGAVAYQVHEEDSTRIHATLYAPVLKEFCLEATRDDESRNWYIEVTDEGGYHTYDGYWRDSDRKSCAEVLAEAVSGSLLDEIGAPPEGAISLAAPSAAIAAREQGITKADVLRVAKEIGLVGWISDCDQWFEFTDTEHPSKLLIRFAEHYAALASREEAPATPQGEAAGLSEVTERYCNKCGYFGPDQIHYRPNGLGECGYIARIRTQPTTVQQEPDPLLIDSMCMRWRHDFGLQRDADDQLSSGMTDADRDSLRSSMRQLWEEVVGRGFYRPAALKGMQPGERKEQS